MTYELSPDHQRQLAITGAAFRPLFDGSENRRLMSGLATWSPEELSTITAPFLIDAERSLERFVTQLREVRVSEEWIPLADEEQRYPLRDLTDETVRAAIRNVLAFPEKDGLLSQIIRRELGVPYQEPADIRRIEIHYDSIPPLNRSTADPELRNHLVRLGLEPDEFHAFVPQNYQGHSTLRLNIPVAVDSLRELSVRSWAERQGRFIEQSIDQTPSANGYVEYEYYKSAAHIARYPYRPIEASALSQFPVAEDAAEIFDVPTTENEAKESGLDLDLKKAADIHIEIPSAIRGTDFPDAEAPAMNQLRERLQTLGYEVKDVWGDTIYTIQCVDMTEATLLYRVLDGFFRSHGGPTQMYLEPCPRVWRKKQLVGGEIVAANVPPLTRLKPRARAALQSLAVGSARAME